MKFHFEDLKRIEYAPKERRFLSDIEIGLLPAGSQVSYDVECFKNLFFVGFKHIETNSYFYVEMTAYTKLNIDKLRWIMWHFELISFNGIDYDIRMIEAALKGLDLEQLKNLSDRIIIEKERFYYPSASFNHIDLKEVAPLKGGLKLYTARLHAKRIQELPVDPHKLLTHREACDTREYNMNDLDNTELLATCADMANAIQMRRRLGAQYGIDLRSKSDAQIAEIVISAEFKSKTGRTPTKNKIAQGYTFNYEPPAYMEFQTTLLKKAFETIKSLTFTLDANGYVNKPREIEKLLLSIGQNTYRMSIGGLHSTESNVAYRADYQHYILDYDVSSYYPQIIITGGIEPDNMKGYFIPIFKSVVDRRIELKRQKNPDADGFKIVTNGTFGKLGSMFSIFYSPKLMIYVTLTGQLGLLMLIEAATLAGFHVASANTDGILFHCPHNRKAELDALIRVWEGKVGFPLEETRYKGYFARDISNYIAVKEDGGCKAKGVYSDKGSAWNSVLSKNPEALICSDAVKALLEFGTPVEQTICNSRDLTRFVVVRNVENPGAHKDGVFLGKVVRWYYALNEYGTINYVANGNTVGKSQGAKPCMELPDEFPADVNLKWYVDEALAILEKIGYNGRNKQRTLFE